jgi:hypothetical protein
MNVEPCHLFLPLRFRLAVSITRRSGRAVGCTKRTGLFPPVLPSSQGLSTSADTMMSVQNDHVEYDRERPEQPHRAARAILSFLLSENERSIGDPT